ncbi:MAG: T9SS type A sorting domain-containing protein [bacterium]
MKKQFLSFVLLFTLLVIGLSQTHATTTITICSGDTTIIGGSITGGYLYSWNTGATTPTITVSPSLNSLYTRTILNSSYTIILQDTFSIIVKPKPFIAISPSGGQTAVCVGGTLQLIANSNPNPIHYQWSTGDTTIGIIASPITNPTIYTVTGTNNGCSTTVSFTLYIQAPPMAYSITGNSNYCPSQWGVVMGLSGSENDCNYMLYHNGIGISAGMGTGGSISFGMVANANGPYTVKGFKNNLGCPAQMNGTLMVTMDSLPGAITNLTVPITQPCEGQTMTYGNINMTSTHATSYLWSVPNGATLVSGQGTQIVTINWGTSLGGIVSVCGVNSCGTGPLATFTVNVKFKPSLTVIATPTTICPGDSTLLSALSNANTYLWNNGNTTPTLYSSPFNNSLIPVTISYTVTVTGSNGCQNNGIVSFTVNPKPNVTLSLVQDHFCPDQGPTVLLGGLPSGPGGIYTGTCVHPGNMVVPSSTPPSTYVITYTYTNPYGCSSSATDLAVFNAATPPTFLSINGPIYVNTPPFDLMMYVSPFGGIFTGPGTNTWNSIFDPHTAGPGVHQIFYTYTHPTTGCSATQSQYISVGAVGINDISTTISYISIFPNPATTQLNLNGIDVNEIQKITITNVLGEVIFITETITENMRLNISDYATGTYLISFINANGISQGKRFVKTE